MILFNHSESVLYRWVGSDLAKRHQIAATAVKAGRIPVALNINAQVPLPVLRTTDYILAIQRVLIHWPNVLNTPIGGLEMLTGQCLKSWPGGGGLFGTTLPELPCGFSCSFNSINLSSSRAL
jgi:hypothetical protein